MPSGPLTATQLRALHILEQHGPMRPAAFASRMWPGRSARWKCGAKGSTVTFAPVGAGYLGRLAAAGLVVWTTTGYGLSRDGVRQLHATLPIE